MERIHTFPKDINLSVNVITRLKFELTYFETAVQYYNHTLPRLPFIIKDYIFCLYFTSSNIPGKKDFIQKFLKRRFRLCVNDR